MTDEERRARWAQQPKERTPKTWPDVVQMALAVLLVGIIATTVVLLVKL